jgi:hypothetical protein
MLTKPIRQQFQALLTVPQSGKRSPIEFSDSLRGSRFSRFGGILVWISNTTGQWVYPDLFLELTPLRI